MHDRLLVPTDGSDVARVAAESAVALAGRFDADVHAIHVLEVGELPPGVEDEGAGEFARRGEQAVAEVADLATEAGLSAVTAVLDRDGPLSVPEAIVAYAEEHGVDGIVMGSQGRRGLDRFVLGSVAEHTLREAPVPVLIVHDRALDPDVDLDRIVVPTDGSESARAAADYGAKLAAATDAELHAVHVVDVGVLGLDGDAAAIMDALEAAGEQALDAVADRAAAAGVRSVQATLLRGSPARSIADYAAEHDVDGVVMGTHGRTGLDRILLGSVAERVVRLTDRPVFAIRR